MILVNDLTNDYPVCVTDTYEEALEKAKEYVATMFKFMNEDTRHRRELYHDDMLKERIVGIDISDIDYKDTIKDVRVNYFFGHIKEDGTIVNKNEQY